MASTVLVAELEPQMDQRAVAVQAAGIRHNLAVLALAMLRTMQELEPAHCCFPWLKISTMAQGHLNMLALIRTIPPFSIIVTARY